MPELPDIENYVRALRDRVLGQVLRRLELFSPFLLRTVDPGPGDLEGLVVEQVTRMGKRIVFELSEHNFAVVHLMIAGRLRWRDPGSKGPARQAQARFCFDVGDLWLTEAGKKKRASLHLVSGREELTAFDRGGLEVLEADLDSFRAAVLRENRTLKRALTDPRILSGIGNAWSDEILFAARLSPVRLTRRLEEAEIERLYEATRKVLLDGVGRLREEVGDGFPEKVTAFRGDMQVHGRYRQPCLVCGEPIQRIRYASNECNYCVQCQNAGRLLADRGLSQLMRRDWPRSLEELEQRKERGRRGGEG